MSENACRPGGYDPKTGGHYYEQVIVREGRHKGEIAGLICGNCGYYCNLVDLGWP